MPHFMCYHCQDATARVISPTYRNLVQPCEWCNRNLTGCYVLNVPYKASAEKDRKWKNT
jgi:hypothetical protein